MLRLLSSLTLAILLGCAVSAWAEDEEDDGRLKIQKKPAAPATVARTPVANLGLRGKLDEWRKAKGLGSTKLEGQRVVFELIGNARVTDGAKMQAMAQQALEGLDIWTGAQGIFSNKVDEQFKTWLVLMPDDATFDQFHDAIGVKSEGDLAKKLKSLNSHNVRITTVTKANNAPLHYAVYASICSALDTYYMEYGGKDASAPPWLREGLNAEMQRLVVGDKQRPVQWMTISYEMNDPQGITQDWAKDIKSYIAGANDKYKGKFLRAGQVTQLGLIKLDPIQYRQMWSFCGFARSAAANVKGDKNKFFQLLQSTALGESSVNALSRIYGWTDPTMSNRWVEWALAQ